MNENFGGGNGGTGNPSGIEGNGYVENDPIDPPVGVKPIGWATSISEVKPVRTSGVVKNAQVSGVAQPGTIESLIPIWGSGRSAVHNFQNGNYWTGTGYTALAISDVFLAKSIGTALGKGAWKLGSHSWSATSKWMKNAGYEGVKHHWAISQKFAKQYGLEALSNQPWNIKLFVDQATHMRLGHGQAYKGVQGAGLLG